jgi:hypothetical protein
MSGEAVPGIALPRNQIWHVCSVCLCEQEWHVKGLSHLF